QRQQTIDNSAVLTCATCVNGVDLSQYEWSKSPLVKIENGKFYIGTQDNSVSIVREKGTNKMVVAAAENVEAVIESAEFSAMIIDTPSSIKHNIDKDYPEYWERIIGIHGGKQAFDSYLESQSVGIVWKNKDGVKFADFDCQFELDVIRAYNGKEFKDPFVNWRKTNLGKEVLYKEILINIRRKENNN
ncbi:MAG: hypothetical protein P1V18_06440, partial [Candidatus Gracilibacteria bacterium]|nr:hypothetical protein [Candidatus Gracilibacteria bacterium]